MSEKFDENYQMNERSRIIFKHLVEEFLNEGQPVGSRTISRVLPQSLSPASVRNVMSDLEHLGLIASPHKSAGRIPTQFGLRMFVDGMLESAHIHKEDQTLIEEHIAKTKNDEHQKDIEKILMQTGNMLSGLSQCAGIVLSEKQSRPIQHIQFVRLSAVKILIVLVYQDNEVENRVINAPMGLPASALEQANNYLNAHLVGRTFKEAQNLIEGDLKAQQQHLDQLTNELILAGLAQWTEDEADKKLIIRGRSNLIEDDPNIQNLNLVKKLFDDLETKKELINLLDMANHADGVRIFIGAESNLFSLSGSSLVVSPFHDEQKKLVGVLGVIGPTRLNYGRVVPVVNYTAKMLGKIITP